MNTATSLHSSSAAFASGQTTYGVLDGLADAARAAARILPEPAASGADFAAALLNGSDLPKIDISENYAALLDRQIETQIQLQNVTFASNIERSEHETRMAAVRNIRVSA